MGVINLGLSKYDMYAANLSRIQEISEMVVGLRRLRPGIIIDTCMRYIEAFRGISMRPDLIITARRDINAVRGHIKRDITVGLLCLPFGLSGSPVRRQVATDAIKETQSKTGSNTDRPDGPHASSFRIFVDDGIFTGPRMGSRQDSVVLKRDEAARSILWGDALY